MNKIHFNNEISNNKNFTEENILKNKKKIQNNKEFYSDTEVLNLDIQKSNLKSSNSKKNAYNSNNFLKNCNNYLSDTHASRNNIENKWNNKTSTPGFSKISNKGDFNKGKKFF